LFFYVSITFDLETFFLSVSGASNAQFFSNGGNASITMDDARFLAVFRVPLLQIRHERID